MCESRWFASSAQEAVVLSRNLHHATPNALGVAGKRLWEAIASEYELRPDEVATLEDVCLITDVIAELEGAWAQDGRPMTTKGSMGQLVIHPLIGEIRTQRMARNTLWRQLKLPDLEPVAPTNQNRDAANASWQPGVRGHGA